MKLSVLQENLAQGLNITNRFVASRAQLPVLSNILLTATEGRLKLSATNLETGINYWVGAKIEKEGAVSIPAKVLTEYIASLPAEKIDLEVKENQLLAKSGSYRATFNSLSASEFPAIPTTKGKAKILFSPEVFKTFSSQVAFAASADEGRPVLNGVLFQVKENELLVVATDGYRLSLKKIKEVKGVSEASELKKGVLLPARTLQEVAKIAGDKEQEEILGLSFTPEANQVIFSATNWEVVSRLIEGEFPDYAKIIPEKGVTELVIDKDELLRAVRTASIFARDSANIIRWEIKESQLILSANTLQVGSNQIKLEVKTKGKPGKTAFNSRFLLDILNSLETEQVRFEIASALSPGVFTLVDDPSFLHLIMPVRVQE